MTSLESERHEHARPNHEGSPIVQTLPIGFPWPTVDPFITAVHHLDHFPAGNADLGPSTDAGRRPDGADFSIPGWGMYYGSVVPGFPQHPHRGFETVTVVRRGTIDHSDSLGATARYGSGDVQWLTAGRGVQHAEMFPLLREDAPNTLELFQIWLNLPADHKMVEPSFTMLWREELPRTVVKDDAGHATEVTVVAGAFGDTQPLPAPRDSWAAQPEAELAIWQFVADPSAAWALPPTAGSATVRTFYLFEGSVGIGGEVLHAPCAVVLRSDQPVAVSAGDAGAAALVLQGRPIGEPVAMGGPFVMNDRREIEQAYRDFQRTGFGGWRWDVTDPVHPSTAPRFAERPDGRTEYPEGSQG